MMNIYQHFRKDEQPFIEQVIDWVLQVEKQYTPYLTDFLNPRERFILKTIVGQYDDVNQQTFGGFPEAEQKRALIYPPYYEPTAADYEITLIEIDYPTKFADLSHGQIMGTILGAGLARNTLGDIITDGTHWQFFINAQMKDFVFMTVTQLGRTSVTLEEKALTDRIDVMDKWERQEVVVSSLRIDVVLARALNLSRNNAKKFISDQRIKINWVEIERPDKEVDEQDIISVRGHGRVQIRKQLARTRKDNIVLEIGLIDRNK